MKHKTLGFTLIELMVIIAIVAIIAAMALPIISKSSRPSIPKVNTPKVERLEQVSGVRVGDTVVLEFSSDISITGKVNAINYNGISILTMGTNGLPNILDKVHPSLVRKL